MIEDQEDDYTLDMFADDAVSEDTDMGNDLAAAFEASEGADDTVAPEPTAVASEEVANLEVVPDSAPLETVPPETPPPDNAPVEQSAKPPQSWGAAEREEWAALPPAVQAQVQKRESEIQGVMQHAAIARNFKTEFDSGMNQYAPLFQAQNVTPMQAVSEVMHTAAGLMSGTAASKAEVAAQLIEQYGIDVQTLDEVLAGKISGGNAANEPDSNFKNYLSEQLAPMQQFMQQQQNQVQQTRQNEYAAAQTELEQFLGNNEFAKDLLTDMNDMVALAGQHNTDMSYQQAYDKALLLRPDIQQIIAQRQGGQTAAQNNQAIQRKQDATVSIPRTSSPLANDPEPTDMRGYLEAAFSNS
jgi:hypothetical protein